MLDRPSVRKPRKRHPRDAQDSDDSEVDDYVTSTPLSQKTKTRAGLATRSSSNRGHDVLPVTHESAVLRTDASHRERSPITPKTAKHEKDDEDDEGCVMLGTVSKSCQGNTPEHLPLEVILRTTFIVTVSSQPTIAPVVAPFTLCTTFNALFETLISECGIRPKLSQRITKISVMNTWDGRQIRIRKGRLEDWEGGTQFDEGCEVETIVHVDDDEF